MSELAMDPLFGVLLTIAAFRLSRILFNKFKLAILSPLLISIIMIVAFLKFFKISYVVYFTSASVLNNLIVPATVCLAIPLYKNFHLLKKHYKSIIAGIIVANTINCFLVGIVCKLLSYPNKVAISFIPKSITTAIALGVSNKLGGIPSITVVLVILTGITGAIVGPIVYKHLNITDDISIGVSLGTSSHAVGSSKAIEYSHEAGAMAALSIVLTGIYVILIAPLVVKLIL